MTTATETRPNIAISSRLTDFNVQISAINIHSHCTQMFGQNCKFNLSLLFFMIIILLGCASVNRNSWGGDPESLGANRSAYYPRDQSLFVYYTPLIDVSGL